MDDLDHSMHIADYDWLSFYEESEECCLLQPSLAYPDNSTLSDSEGLDSSVYTRTDCTQPPVQLERRPSDDHQAEENSVLPQDTEVLQKGLPAIQCLDEGAAQLESKVGQQPAESDLKAEQEPELPTSEGGVCDYVSSAGSRAEKERWFVTLNINPQHWAPGTWVKKKRRQKKWKKDATHKLQSDMCFDHDITNQVKKESVRASDTDSIQCHQDKYSECAEIRLESSQIELITDSNMCLTKSLCKDPYSTRESISKTTMDTNEPNDDLSFITDASVSDTVESEEFAEADFFSSCSYDSENYVSATESVEEPQHLSMQNVHLNLSENVNADSSVDGGMHFSDSSLISSTVAISCRERMSSRAHVEPSQTILSPHHRADNMPNENYSTWSNGTESTELCMSSDTPISELNSSGPEKDQIESLPQAVSAVTADSPEAYARAIGNTQSVYAISAFWDEMEKLTINDILHLKMGRSMLPGETCSADELVGSTGNVAGASDNGSVVSSMDCNLADSMVLDMSDTADSDYFTHIDESKPDRSSCDFSTSNFVEEYWQFLNSSRNSSPDHQDKSSQSHRTSYSSFSTYEEDSDEMGTPVPSEDCSGQQWPHGSTFSLCDLTSPQHLRKNKSMYNVHALNSLEDLTLQSFFDQSCCRPLEENVSMKTSDSFNISTCAPIMCYTDEQYQISFPRVFEYLFTDNKEKYEVMSVTLYGLREIPKSPAHDYTFCAVDSDLPLISFCDSECSEEPIPIFSCTHPTVRELTFPKAGYIFLGTNSMTLEDVSPIRVVSQSLIRNFNCKRTDRSYWFSQDLSSLFSIKKFCFHDKGCDAWTYQVEAEKKPVNAIDSHFGVVTEGGASSVTSKLLRDTAVRQITDNQISTNPPSIFSTIKQSDMCLVCIAFASWVLKSSDPEAADAWKAALLANVSALSAIQYLRQYMKKNAHPQDDQ